ncbi:hypothetical protein EVAR_87711_1 [Eumeta japonica]|uniref:Uncharacterized protein n=1 Tax=Eumeta variegata TaxID=151549 RepID=A0A4C2A6V1_EUMVA|nr:hypothetical protein EVAR_87711_1 [Eumeta japonica]
MCIRPVMTYACPVLLTPPDCTPRPSAAASYEAPPENHFLRRPRNASQTRQMTSLRRRRQVPTRVVNLRDSLCRGSERIIRRKSRDGICRSVASDELTTALADSRSHHHVIRGFGP